MYFKSDQKHAQNKSDKIVFFQTAPHTNSCFYCKEVTVDTAKTIFNLLINHEQSLITKKFLNASNEWQLALSKYHLTICSVLDAGSVLPVFW